MSDEEYQMTEKTKGKRRAYPINTSAGSIPAAFQTARVPKRLSLIVRFADGSPDLSLEMSQDGTGATVTEEIRAHRFDLKDKHLRLIHAGKPILNHTSLQSLQVATVVSQGDEREAEGRKSFSAWSPMSPKSTKSKSNSTDSPEKSTLWIHCAIGDIIDPTEQQSGALSTADAPPAYERFTDAGMSSSEVQIIRNLFRRVMFGASTNGSATTTSEYAPTDEQTSHLEARWLESITQPSAYELPASPHPFRDVSSPSSARPAFPTRILGYLLPRSVHATATRSATQGLLFAFFFPLVAGLVMDSMSRPAAFFDGSVWPELSARTMEAAFSLTDEDNSDPQVNSRASESDINDREHGRASGEDVASANQTRPPRSERLARLRQMAPDVVADSVPSNVFTESMQTAIRAGLILNVVCGFYLWLYAS